MKIRADFVTNSSSALFLLGFKNGELTQKQKNAIVEYIATHALGVPIASESFKSICHWFDETGLEQRVNKLHENDWSIQCGSVSFEFGDEEYAGFLQGLWQAIAKADPKNTKLLNIELDY